MSNPPPYVPSFSFSGFQETNPTDPPPGPMLDNEFDNVANSLALTITALSSVRRSDGALVNGIVTPESLSSDLTIGVQTPTAWVTAHAYAAGNIVIQSNKFYTCVVAHTSGVFATDLAAVKWIEVTLSITGYAADQVTYDHTISGLAAVNVKTALDEIDADVDVLQAQAVGVAAQTWTAAQQLVARGNISAALKGQLFGLTTGPGNGAGGGDLTNDVTVAAGEAASTEASPILIVLPSALTKQLDVNWAPGTNLGGRYSGVAIANGTYLAYLVSKANGVAPDVYLHPSGSTNAQVLAHLQAEPGGSLYVHIRRIGSFMRAAAAIRPWTQEGSRFLYPAGSRPTDRVTLTGSGGGINIAVSTPAGINARPIIIDTIVTSVAGQNSVGFDDGGVSTTPVSLMYSSLVGEVSVLLLDGTFKTDLTSQLRFGQVVNGTLTLADTVTIGYYDDREMFA